MNILILGLGSIGQRHLANARLLKPDAQITLLRRSSSQERLHQVEAFNAQIVYSMEDALASRPDMAILANPAPFHMEIAIALANENVHLLIEKPLSHDLNRVDELLDCCQRSSSVLMVGYNLRFSESLQKVKQILDMGLLGQLLSIRAEVGQYLPDWRPGSDYRDGVSAQTKLGGGAILELSHELDYVRWLMGEVKSVFATANRVSDLEIDVEDIAEIILHFECGAIGNIHLDFLQRTPHRTCRVIGSEGTLSWNGILDTLELYSVADGWQEVYSADTTDRNQMYVAELQHFFDCVESGEQPMITGLDGKHVLEIALAAKQSSSENRMVVL